MPLPGGDAAGQNAMRIQTMAPRMYQSISCLLRIGVVPPSGRHRAAPPERGGSGRCPAVLCPARPAPLPRRSRSRPRARVRSCPSQTRPGPCRRSGRPRRARRGRPRRRCRSRSPLRGSAGTRPRGRPPRRARRCERARASPSRDSTPRASPRSCLRGGRGPGSRWSIRTWRFLSFDVRSGTQAPGKGVSSMRAGAPALLIQIA